MRRPFPGGAVVVLSLAMVWLSAPVQAQTKEEPAPPKTLEVLQKTIKSEVEKNHVPGAGVALISRGELLWCGGIGDADAASKRPVTCDTEFRVGSISKTFVALALLKLQEEGKIDLEARLRDVTPEVPITNALEAPHPFPIVNLPDHTPAFGAIPPPAPSTAPAPPDYPPPPPFTPPRHPHP